jgi:D-beta-D-heptose 7-phosphate kinase/D-beta-D-heptose 1-phosphate adenosyltransferase
MQTQAAPIFHNDQDLLALVQEWKAQGHRWVFTNGCFDLLHPGHLRVLREAAAQGDRLVVALNDDASVRGLKGPQRPVQDENARAALLSALVWVDAVVLFGQDDPGDLIRLLVPDVLVKGGDYTVETVVGADTVLQAGGRVHLVSLLEGHSTTSLTHRFQKKL